MTEPQAAIDSAYEEGKRAYLRDVGTHGPTLRPRAFFHSPNPYPVGTLRRESWARGYNQDTRRVVEGVTVPTIQRVERYST